MHLVHSWEHHAIRRISTLGNSRPFQTSLSIELIYLFQLRLANNHTHSTNPTTSIQVSTPKQPAFVAMVNIIPVTVMNNTI